MLENASKSAGLDTNYWQIDFPNGPIDVIDYFIKETDVKMANALKGSNLRTTEKIRTALKFRFESNNKYKQQIKSMLGVYAQHPIHSTKIISRTADAIWRAAGDTATDFNFYTKRMLLAGVYSSTMLYWLEDKSENNLKTWEFLDNRLKDVGKFGKGIAQVKDKLNKLGKFQLFNS